MANTEDRFSTKYITLNKIDNLQEFLKEIVTEFSQSQIEDSHVLMQLYTMPVIEKEFEEASAL